LEKGMRAVVRKWRSVVAVVVAVTVTVTVTVEV
jgi:hypothetical protein